jgi:hypothetical protein
MSFTIVCYSDWSGNETSKHCFSAKNGRQVVGLIKTIMDNFHPVHVDILLDGSQDDLTKRGIIDV